MKRKITWTTLILLLLVVAFLNFTPSAASRSSVPRPMFATTLDVDRNDDNAGANACTIAANDCSLRGAIIAANADPNADPVIINLQPATTYHLTLTNATQENAAATGDLDITTTLHSVTIVGGGSDGPNATIIEANALNAGSTRDRVFHITTSGVTAIFQDLVIQNGKAADDGTSGNSTNPATQISPGTGGGILNNGNVTLTNVKIDSCEAIGKGDTIINQHTELEAHGGGLASLSGTANVIISGSRFIANNATGGNGGNFNNGAGSAAKGGAIYLESGTLNMNLSQIDNSDANGGNGGNQDQNGQTNGGFGGLAQGGGLWVGSGATVTINNTTFENTAAIGGDSGTGGNGANPGGEANGGGVYSLGNTTVTNSTFHLTAANGGNGGNAFGTTCLGAHNAGDGGAARGGAIFADSGSLIVNTATFANNSVAGGNGGNGGQTDGGLNCGMHGAGGLVPGGALTKYKIGRNQL